jgi:hypothetical protein
MSMNNTSSVIRAALTLGIFMSAGLAYAQTDCTSAPVNPTGGTSSTLENALQQASNTGLPVRITGYYNIHSPIHVIIRDKLIVDATDATFMAGSDLDGDMFSFDANYIYSSTCGNVEKVDISWKGGLFNVSNALVSRVVPLRDRTPAGRESLISNTADALSIRGVSVLQKVREVTIDGVTVVGTSSSTGIFSDAGGDSGVFIMGAVRGTVKNSVFRGIRDAAIYVSADPDYGYGNNYTITGNTIERAYTGISSKRGPNNVVMKNNVLTDVVLGLSTLPLDVANEGIAATVEITGNTITTAGRAILLQRANGVTVNNNNILQLGGVLAGQSSSINPHGNIFEGIIFEGVQGASNQCIGNTMSGIGGTRKNITTTRGLVGRSYQGHVNTDIVRLNNNFSNLDNNIVGLPSGC